MSRRGDQEMGDAFPKDEAMTPVAQRCPFCSYERIGDGRIPCPECGKHDAEFSGKRLAAAMVIVMILNSLVGVIAFLATLVCLSFAFNHNHWDFSMTLVAVGFLASVVGFGGSGVVREHADELALPRNRKQRVAMLFVATAGLSYAVLFIASLMVAALMNPW